MSNFLKRFARRPHLKYVLPIDDDGGEQRSAPLSSLQVEFENCEQERGMTARHMFSYSEDSISQLKDDLSKSGAERITAIRVYVKSNANFFDAVNAAASLSQQLYGCPVHFEYGGRNLAVHHNDEPADVVARFNRGGDKGVDARFKDETSPLGDHKEFDSEILRVTIDTIRHEGGGPVEVRRVAEYALDVLCATLPSGNQPPPEIKRVTAEVGATTLNRAVRHLRRLSSFMDSIPVEFEFSGVLLTVDPHTTTEFCLRCA